MNQSPASPIRNPQRLSIPPRLPVKQRVYPHCVTVCIAAICRRGTEPVIILCTDTRMSAGEYGSTDSTNKMHVIVPGWGVMASNRADSANELIERLREWFGTGEFPSVHDMLSKVKGAVDEFMEHSPLFERNCCELLITGFVKRNPIVVVISGGAKGRLAIRVADNYCAIGSGALISTVILNCRNYSNRDNIEVALYLVYEAKRLSEKADGVGPLTSMVWISPDEAGSLSKSGREHLEAVFVTKGMGAGLSFPGFPDGSIEVTSPDPPHPTGAPSPLPPSPESSEESGES